MDGSIFIFPTTLQDQLNSGPFSNYQICMQWDEIGQPKNGYACQNYHNHPHYQTWIIYTDLFRSDRLSAYTDAYAKNDKSSK